MILSHEGHVPDPRDSRFFPVYRGLTQGEHRQLIEISEATPLERQQLTKLLSHRLQRFVDAKDVSNARSKSSKSSIEGLSETAKLLNSLSSGDGWEVDITFHGSPNGEIPAAYYIFHDSWVVKLKAFHDVLLIDGTYKVRHTLFHSKLQVRFRIS